MKYKCSKCEEEHEGWFAIAFNVPYPYHVLTEEEKNEIAEISEDFCVICYHEQTDRFIRGVLHQKVNDHCQDLEYGVWVSLSEKSFNDYLDNFELEHREGRYFGWLSNQIPGYEDTLRIKTNVILSKEGYRPEVVVQEDNDFKNQFVYDYFNGISKDEAERRLSEVMEKTE